MSNYKEDLISEMLICMKEADLTKWMTLVYSKDDLANEALRDWFQGRIQAEKIMDIQLKVLDLDYEHSDMKTKCQLMITYEEYEPVTEIHIYTFEYVPERNRNCVVWLEKERQYFPFGSYDEQHKFVIHQIKCDELNVWWKDETLVNEFVGSNDPFSVEKYARAIIRNIRFREGCLELECASLLSNMMSARLNGLYDQIYDTDKKKLLANIFNATKDFFKVQLIRDDRDNTWSSKFAAPWYGFDELIELNKNNDQIKGSCFSFISFIYALLRICGFSEPDIYQLRLINQDILVIFIEGSPFIINQDNIIPWNSKSIYFRNRVSKMFTEYWCIADRNYIGLSEEQMVCEVSKMQSHLGRFNFFDHKYDNCGSNLVENNPLNHKMIIHFEKKGYIDIVKEVIKKGKERSDSAFVWAKYAHQMLYVTKPEAYLEWSIQSKVVTETLLHYEKFEDWLDMLRTFEKESIFSEDFRIMTADQCIRYKKGDSKSLLTALYVWFVVKKKQNGILVFTTKGYYCICVQYGQMFIWDGDTLEQCSEIEGNIILAFNHKESYYPLLYRSFDVRLKANELWDYMLYTNEMRTKITKYNLLFHLPKKFDNTLDQFNHFNKESRVLILSPHYDDDVIGCGGIINKYCRSGCVCSVLYFTDGTKNKKAIEIKQYKEIRKSEAIAALGKLGNVSAHCLEEKDGELSASKQVVDQLQKRIIELGVDTIFFPNIKDSYSDHNVVGKILSMALKKVNTVRKLYMYEIIECLQNPNIYFEMDEVAIHSKREAIGRHQTQIEYMDYLDISEKINQIRGTTIGKKACEVFKKIDKEELYQYYND